MPIPGSDLRDHTVNTKVAQGSGPFRTWIQRTLFPLAAPKSGAPGSLSSFGARYLLGFAVSAYLFVGGFAHKRHRLLLNYILSHFGFEPYRPSPELPTVQIHDVIRCELPVVLHEPVARDGNVSLLELLILAQIVAERQPEAVFEIGTFDGRTTLNLAANTKGHVFTLDLPAGQASSTKLPLDPADTSYISKPRSGERFAGKPEARRITQLFGDSASFDFTEWEGQIELAFIDGAHSREYVLSDTECALRLLRPAGGIIVWHDYDACFNGVTEALHEIARRGQPVRQIAGTSLAILATGDSSVKMTDRAY